MSANQCATHVNEQRMCALDALDETGRAHVNHRLHLVQWAAVDEAAMHGSAVKQGVDTLTAFTRDFRSIGGE